MRTKVLNGQEPWFTAFNKVKAENNYLSHTPGAMATMYAAANRNDDGDRDVLVEDAEVAYGCALIWYITRDELYAKKAIQIIDNWATVNKVFDGFDRALVAGYGPPAMIYGAEIIRHSYTGWTTTQIQRFEGWLNTVIWPLIKGGSGNNPNWQSWMACCAMSIAVFESDSTKWSTALNLFHGVLPRTIKSSGQPGEVCRDLHHSQMGIAPLTFAAEIGRKQGLDLYREVAGDNRLLKGTEYIVPLLLDSVTKDPISGCTLNDKSSTWYFYQFIYNHYNRRKGLSTPQTLRMINSSRYAGFEKFARGGWGTLTHNEPAGGIPSGSNPPPTVSITSPSNGANYTAPATIAISATASDSGGSITKVEFLSGSTLLGSDSSSPYSLQWNNVSAGNYALSAKATDNGGAIATSAGVNITVIASSTTSSTGGSLTHTKSTQPASLSLSIEGSRDWGHWGLNATTDWNHKSGVTAQISNFTKIGTATVNRYTDGTCANSWTGGTPTASVTSTTAGIYVAGVSNGFQVTVPADQTLRTLRIYCGLWKSQGKLEATLSDGSASGIVDTSHGSTAGSANTQFSISYKAASAGQTLTVKWTVQTSHDTAGAGTVGWQAATLH